MKINFAPKKAFHMFSPKKKLAAETRSRKMLARSEVKINKGLAPSMPTVRMK